MKLLLDLTRIKELLKIVHVDLNEYEKFINAKNCLDETAFSIYQKHNNKEDNITNLLLDWTESDNEC